MSKKKKIQSSRVEYKIRLNQVGPLSENLPLTAKLILEGLKSLGKQLSSFSFIINRLPPTANHMYEHTRFNTRLTEETKAFRIDVANSIGLNRLRYKCGGTAAVLIFLESPNWITKKLTIREWDADNRVKSLLDAVKHWINVPDETNWELHVWKIASKHTRTTCHLFDLGDLVNFYS